MYCSKCGQQMVEGANYCSGCGKGAGSGPVAGSGIGKVKALYVFAAVAVLAMCVAAANMLWFTAASPSYTSSAVAQAHVSDTQAQDENGPRSIEERLESIEQRLESIEHWLERIAGYVEWRVFVWDYEIFIDPGETPPPIQREVVFRPVIPPGGRLEHFIEPGQSLASIAQIYWPHNPETPSGRLLRDELVRHLAETNGIANPEILFAGQWLLIYEHPEIDQVFD